MTAGAVRFEALTLLVATAQIDIYSGTDWYIQAKFESKYIASPRRVLCLLTPARRQAE